MLGMPNHPVNIISTRHGEKLFEALLGREGMLSAQELGPYYCVAPDSRDLNYSKYFEQGETKTAEAVEYTSQDTTRLKITCMQTLLKQLRFHTSPVTRRECQDKGVAIL